MAKYFLAVLYCFTVTFSFALGSDNSQQYSSYSSSSSSIASSNTADTTQSRPTTSSTATSATSLPSSYTLVTSEKPTDAPWSVSYWGYTSLSTSSSAAASASPSGVRFHPDGASPGFYCEYPTLSQWQSCNTADSRDCWLRKPKNTKIKERCNCTDDEPDEINIHTDCMSKLLYHKMSSSILY